MTRWVVLVLAAALIWFGAAAASRPIPVVYAQGVAWDAPILVSESDEESLYPTIAADPVGDFHLFWGEVVDINTATSGVIYYSRWSNGTLSPPVDILYSPQGVSARAERPSAVVDPEGYVHVVWAGGYGDQLYYSRASHLNASDKAAWTDPVPLNRDGDKPSWPHMVIDSSGRIHVVYAVVLGDNAGVRYLTSSDGGLTWTEPVWIPSTADGYSEMADVPRIAVDDVGAIHVVWMIAPLPQSYPPSGIMYARSTDQGQTWTEPQALTTGPFGFGAIAAGRDGGVVATWSGTLDQRHKFVASSDDGGRMWSAAEIIPNVGGFQGIADMTVDGAGTMHLAMVASVLDVGTDMLVTGELGNGPMQLQTHNVAYDRGRNPMDAQIDIALGNQLGVVYEVPDVVSGRMEIYFLRGQSGAKKQDAAVGLSSSMTRGLAAAPLSALATSPTTTAVTAVATSAVTFNRRVLPVGGAIQPAAVAALLTASLVGGAVILARRQRRHH